jgi:hypothetical protein
MQLGIADDVQAGWHAPHLHACSRKTLIYLILTLNHIYPDYDFSQLRAQHFRKEASLATAEEAIDTRLIDVSKVRKAPVTHTYF